MNEQLKLLRCFLDGDALCICTEEFTNIQISDVMFVTLTDEQLNEYKYLENKK